MDDELAGIFAATQLSLPEFRERASDIVLHYITNEPGDPTCIADKLLFGLPLALPSYVQHDRLTAAREKWAPLLRSVREKWYRLSLLHKRVLLCELRDACSPAEEVLLTFHTGQYIDFDPTNGVCGF